jgi:hypothetical protein
MDETKLFRIALIVRDMDYQKFAEQHGVSKQFISQLLAGKTQSKRIEKAIDEFVLGQMKDLKNYLNNEIAA